MGILSQGVEEGPHWPGEGAARRHLAAVVERQPSADSTGSKRRNSGIRRKRHMDQRCRSTGRTGHCSRQQRGWQRPGTR